MRVLNSIIIDDERPARKELSFLLKDIPGVEVVGEADDIEKAIELIKQLKPDLVFLDIQLSGENGFDLLEKVCIDFKIVFVTAFDEYAIKAFDVNASDYLLKPVDPERLEKTIKRIQGGSARSQSSSEESIIIRILSTLNKVIVQPDSLRLIPLLQLSLLETIQGFQHWAAIDILY